MVLVILLVARLKGCTSVISCTTTAAAAAAAIFPNRRQMRGLVIVSKYKYGQQIARYRQKVYKCNILMELKISFAKYLKTPKKGLQTVSESLIK